jgi:(2R)-3-sulfolactate dehydrogenase (NADP+)
LQVDEARALCQKALMVSGASEKNGAITADALVRAEADGQRGHGLSRVPSYAAQVIAGKVNGQAEPSIEDVKPGLFRVDAGNGFAYPAIKRALSELSSRASELGIAAAAIYRSHHFGVAGHPCEDMARQGLITFVYGNTPKAIAPYGAKKTVLGTNPVAFGAPLDRDPLVIDFALSVVARGKINAAKQAGKTIPKGWALGPDGKSTTNPEIALEGSMMPIGGVKGAALALMIEVMSACLAGSALSAEAPSLFDGDGKPPNLGQVILAIDAESLSGGMFAERMRDLAAIYDELDGARFPGSGRLKQRAKSNEQGLDVPVVLLEEIKALLADSCKDSHY